MAYKITVADQKYEYLTPEVGRRAQLGAVGGGRGAGALWPLWQDSTSEPRNSIRF